MSIYRRKVCRKQFHENYIGGKIGKKIFKTFAFTWSPDEKLYNMEHVKSRMDDQCAYCAVYFLYPEYRDYDNRSGLHYHGIIYCYDFRKWNSRYSNSFKMYVCKPYMEFQFTEKTPEGSGYDQWLRYCIKECHLNDYRFITNLFSENPILHEYKNTA